MIRAFETTYLGIKTAKGWSGSLQFNKTQQVTKQYVPYKAYCFTIN